MHERRYRPGVTVLNGRIYVMGGEEGWDRYHDTIEIYDPERDRWEVAGHMPSARSWLSCVGLRVSESPSEFGQLHYTPLPNSDIASRTPFDFQVKSDNLPEAS